MRFIIDLSHMYSICKPKFSSSDSPLHPIVGRNVGGQNKYCCTELGTGQRSIAALNWVKGHRVTS